MTIIEAIKARVNYPLTTPQAEEKIIGRGMNPSSTYDASVASSKEFKLAYADTLRFVLTMVNLSQGGSITAQNVIGMQGTANAIYREYGEPLVGSTGDEVSMIRDRSNDW